MTSVLRARPLRAIERAWRIGLVVMLLSLLVLVSLGKGGAKVLGIFVIAGLVAPFVEIALLLPTAAGFIAYLLVVFPAACCDFLACPQEVVGGAGSYRLSRRMLLGSLALLCLMCVAVVARAILR